MESVGIFHEYDIFIGTDLQIFLLRTFLVKNILWSHMISSNLLDLNIFLRRKEILNQVQERNVSLLIRTKISKLFPNISLTTYDNKNLN